MSCQGNVLHWRRVGNVVASGLAAATLASVLAACGAAEAIKTSKSSGQPGALVTVSGNAGGSCVPGRNWFGVSFERSGDDAALATMTPPVTASGSWRASFMVPAYLGSSAPKGAGAVVTRGRYEFVASTCKGHSTMTASFWVTTSAPAPEPEPGFVSMAATPDGLGYWLAQANGQVQAYGDAKPYGSLPAGDRAQETPIAAIVRTYDGGGYWLVNSKGHVYSFGDARPHGSLPARKAAQAPITSMAATPDGRGYWLLAADGHIYAFGDARLQGMPDARSAPYDAIVARPAGGYIVTGADNGESYAYPGGNVLGGGPGYTISATLVGAAATPSGNGVWLAGSDGAVYDFGDAAFYGSIPGETPLLAAPVTGIAGRPDGRGYWLLAADGSVYGYGDAPVFPTPVAPSGG
jgi:hypothetical protein